ncbi:hypothetical protein [Actinomadura violacea]|nr:hypothetical protein [Actinomadura violacea]
MTNEPRDVFAPAGPGPITPRDRTVKAATYEGLTTEPAWGASA